MLATILPVEAVCAGVAILVYINTLGAEFVYDDSRAIVKNLDVRPTTSIWNIFKHDYWGTPMTHSGSHKSFRPVTTLSFRINFFLSGLNPWSYHLFNVLLHGLATWLFTHFIKERIFKTKQKSALDKTLLAGLYFAVHPIHTESVAGVVGRADILSAVFVFAALLTYSNYCDLHDSRLPNAEESQVILDVPARSDHKIYKKTDNILTNNVKKARNSDLVRRRIKKKINKHDISRPDTQRNSSNSADCERQNQTNLDFLSSKKFQLFYAECLTYFVASLAIFSKEIGYSALPLCLVYDVWIRNKLGVYSVIKILLGKTHSVQQKKLQKRLRRIIAATTMIIGLRVFPWIILSSGSSTPVFSSADNPTSSSESLLVRILTFNYLIYFNALLLIAPTTLSYDWGEIPAVKSLKDPRTFLTMGFHALTLFAMWKLWSKLRIRDAIDKEKSGHSSNLYNCDLRKKFSCNETRKNFADKCFESIQTNSVDQGFALENVDEQPSNMRFQRGESTHRFFLDHVKNNSNSITNIEKAESTHSSGYASDSAEEDNTKSTAKPVNKPPSTQFGLSAARNAEGISKNISIHPTITDVTILGFAWLIIPFLPATNLFFYVGFVVAERILYLPSAGYCILFVNALFICKDRLLGRRRLKSFQRSATLLINACSVFLLVLLAARTVLRNCDWKNEFNLYSSGTATSPAKSWSNLGNVLKERGRIKDAENCYLKALSVRGNMADVHYNLGLLYQEQKRFEDALHRYRLAIRFRKTLAVAHLNSGIVLTELGKTEEAEQMYRLTAKIDGSGLRDPHSHAKAKISALYNLGRLLASQNRHLEAVREFRDAVGRLTPDYEPQSLYNMLGQSLWKVGEIVEAEHWIKASLKSNPNHIPAHLAYALLLKGTERIEMAIEVYENVIKLDPGNCLLYNHYAKLLLQQGILEKAVKIITRAYGTKCGPENFDTVMLAGDIYRRREAYEKAEYFFRVATKIKPKVPSGHINLGATLHLLGKYDEARSSYIYALKLDSSDQTAAQNLQKLNRSQQQK